MISQSALGDRTQMVPAGTVLRLEDPQTMWLIESGAVALFLTASEHGRQSRPRRYLFAAEAGELLVSFAAAGGAESPTKPQRLIAVPITDAILRRCDRARWDSDPDQGAPLLLGWCQHLSAVFELTGLTLPLPEMAPHTPWATQLIGLEAVHQQFLQTLHALDTRSPPTPWRPLDPQHRQDQAATAGAIADLASLVVPQPVVARFFEDPLLAAAGAVGHAMGIQITPPAASEDMHRVKEPLEAIARASQMRLRPVHLTERWWRSDCGPLLAYLHRDHTPVALLPNAENQYTLYNPVTQARLSLSDRTAALLGPTAYMFYPPFCDSPVSLFTLAQYSLRGRGPELVNLAIMGLLTTLVGMVVPQATGILIDTAIPDADRGLLLQLTLGLLAASFGVALFRFAMGISLSRLENYAYINTQSALWDRLLKLRIAFFRRYPSGELLARVNAINKIRLKLGANRLDQLIKSSFSLLNVGLLVLYSPRLAGIAVIVVLLTALITSIARYSKHRAANQPSALAALNVNGLTVQLIGGISKLRTTGAEQRAFAFWTKQYREVLRLNRDEQHIEDITAICNLLQVNLTPILIFWMTASLLHQGETGGLSIGTFLAFNTAFATFMIGVTTLSNSVVDLLEIGTLWKFAKPIVEALPEIDLTKADPGRLSGHVRLDHVTFRYRDDGPLNLDDVTLEAKPGEFIAFVGPSGSGKSTLLRMLLGFDVPEQGTVYLDGQDLAGWDGGAVRRQWGGVLQNGRINSETVFENISGGALISMAEAWEAARMAGFDQDIAMMPLGIHTVISEGGSNLSGGQRQRLLIARALVLKPRIILFDEATSALDNRTQAIVSHSLEQMQVTRIAIAHRLSTIRHADRIYVIDAGRVVQQGTFDDLSQQPGLFQHLLAK